MPVLRKKMIWAIWALCVEWCFQTLFLDCSFLIPLQLLDTSPKWHSHWCHHSSNWKKQLYLVPAGNQSFRFQTKLFLVKMLWRDQNLVCRTEPSPCWWKWASQSRDLNSIEHLWTDLQMALHKCSLSKLCDLERICLEEWEKLPKSRFKFVET